MLYLTGQFCKLIFRLVFCHNILSELWNLICIFVKCGTTTWFCPHMSTLLHCKKKPGCQLMSKERVWLVTSRLGTGKSLTFFYSLPAMHSHSAWQSSPHLPGSQIDSHFTCHALTLCLTVLAPSARLTDRLTLYLPCTHTLPDSPRPICQARR